ncbi:hypothetical protein [Dyadobacter psychrotolerans]|uniref:DUF2634 domain-containing protein n=1 Tax=Dyadobacter psychrotolerans TaxID=2541721 RepID=A0A4R5E1M1_9BACT|nr:hypothetical protein [Dyadobacter psychrotolerans]TDE17723.1 hypothetical protein E0F88_07480 [Dyadobacter psychrotolerans]
MIFRNLDENFDFTFGKGKSNYLSEVDAIGLHIKTRLLSWVGDCFFALEDGVDWVNRLGSKNQRALLEADLRRIVLQSDGVTGIISFDTYLNAANRDFTASYNVTTVYSSDLSDTLQVGN